MKEPLQRAIVKEMVSEMQINPWLIASQKTGLGIDHAKTRTLAIELSKQHIFNLRASAFIFGDTYEEQPIDETKQLMINEGYQLIVDSESEMLYLHESLCITAKVKANNDNLEYILLICDFDVDLNQLKPEFLTGLGAQGEIINNKFNCTVDATCGLCAKMFVLRHFATDGSVV